MNRIAYSAVVLDQKSRNTLIKVVSKYIPSTWTLIAHHATICLGELPNSWKHRKGESVKLFANSLGITDLAFAIKITNFDRVKPGQSHITIAVNDEKGGKPKDSESIVYSHNFLGDKGFLILTGTIQEIPAENETIKYNNLILKLLQEQIANDVNGDLRFGQILGNLNINYFADTSDPSNQNFNLKDIYNQSSKVIYDRIVETLTKNK